MTVGLLLLYQLISDRQHAAQNWSESSMINTNHIIVGILSSERRRNKSCTMCTVSWGCLGDDCLPSLQRKWLEKRLHFFYFIFVYAYKHSLARLCQINPPKKIKKSFKPLDWGWPEWKHRVWQFIASLAAGLHLFGRIHPWRGGRLRGWAGQQVNGLERRGAGEFGGGRRLLSRWRPSLIAG